MKMRIAAVVNIDNHFLSNRSLVNILINIFNSLSSFKVSSRYRLVESFESLVLFRRRALTTDRRIVDPTTLSSAALKASDFFAPDRTCDADKKTRGIVRTPGSVYRARGKRHADAC